MIDGGIIDFGALVIVVSTICILGNHVYNRWFGIDKKISILYKLVVAGMIVNMNSNKVFRKNFREWQPEAYSILQGHIRRQNGRNGGRR